MAQSTISSIDSELRRSMIFSDQCLCWRVFRTNGPGEYHLGASSAGKLLGKKTHFDAALSADFLKIIRPPRQKHSTVPQSAAITVPMPSPCEYNISFMERTSPIWPFGPAARQQCQHVHRKGNMVQSRKHEWH